MLLGVVGGFSGNSAASVGTYAPVSPKPCIPPSCTEYSRLPSLHHSLLELEGLLVEYTHPSHYFPHC